MGEASSILSAASMVIMHAQQGICMLCSSLIGSSALLRTRHADVHHSSQLGRRRRRNMLCVIPACACCRGCQVGQAWKDPGPPQD